MSVKECFPAATSFTSIRQDCGVRVARRLLFVRGLELATKASGHALAVEYPSFVLCDSAICITTRRSVALSKPNLYKSAWEWGTQSLTGMCFFLIVHNRDAFHLSYPRSPRPKLPHALHPFLLFGAPPVRDLDAVDASDLVVPPDLQKRLVTVTLCGVDSS